MTENNETMNISPPPPPSTNIAENSTEIETPVEKPKRKYTRRKKVEAKVEETPKAEEKGPKLLKVRTKKAFPIFLRHVNIMVRPGTVQAVPEHPYVEKQVQLGSIEVVEE